MSLTKALYFCLKSALKVILGTEASQPDLFIIETGWTRDNQKYKNFPQGAIYFCTKSGPKMMVLDTKVSLPKLFTVGTCWSGRVCKGQSVPSKGSYVFRFVALILISWKT